jgi:hypothetical protein
MVDTGARACPVCEQNANIISVASMIDGYRIECPRCGTFITPGMLLDMQLKGQHSDAATKELLPYLSAYIRQANERREPVVLDENWRDFALAHKNTPISRKATKLLELIAARSKYGHPTQIDSTKDLPLIDVSDLDEFAFILRHLEELGYITSHGSRICLKS